MSRILHKSFRYVDSASTDISKTFRRIRAEQKAKAEEEEWEKKRNKLAEHTF